MPTQGSITFAVTTYGSDEVLSGNFLTSACLRRPHDHQILVQKDYSSAAKAYNEAIERADNDLMVFVHQDVVLPEAWLSQLELALAQLQATDAAWGVLGCWGMGHEGTAHGCIYSPGPGLLGGPFDRPEPIQTLDEIVLIFRRSSGLRFDDSLPHFHFYGTDICMRAAKMGMRSYVIPAYCVHNTNHYLVLPSEFYESCRHIKRTWKDALPIHTTCLRVTKRGFPTYKRRLQEIYVRYILRRAFLAPRTRNVARLVRQAASAWSAF
jgi:hypothetical protein